VLKPHTCLTCNGMLDYLCKCLIVLSKRLTKQQGPCPNPSQSKRLEDLPTVAPQTLRKAKSIAKCVRLGRIGLVSGTAQVRHLAALIDRYAHELDSVSIWEFSIRDFTFGHHRWD
jgi:hypothetical protein